MFKISARKVRGFAVDFADCFSAGVVIAIVVAIPMWLLSVAVISVLLQASPVAVGICHAQGLREDIAALVPVWSAIVVAISLLYATVSAMWVVE